MRKSTLLLSCLSIACAATALWLWNQWQHERAANLDLQARVAALESRETAAPEMSTVSAALPDSPPPGIPAAKPVSHVQAAVPALAPGSRPAQDGHQIKDPEFRKAMRNRQRVDIEDEYRDLPKMLGLSPDQANRLFDLLADQGVRILEAQWLTPEDGKSRGDAYREARARNDAELTEFLGASNMIRLQEFRSSLQGRAEVNSVRSELARGPEPLREDQVDPMLAIVNTELQRMNQEIRDVGAQGAAAPDPAADAKRVELMIAANQRILDAARPILTSAQLAGLEELYRRQRLQMEAEGTIRRMQFATQGK